MLKVTTPAANKRLTTVAAVRAHCGMASGDLNDAGVEALIDRASDMAASYCGRVFATETVRQTEFPQSGLLSIPLARYPVALDGLTVTENGTELTLDADFVLDEVATLRRVSNGYRRAWCGSVVIDYAAGYVLPDDDGERTLPHDLEMAVLYLIGDVWQSIKQAPNGGHAIRSLALEGVGTVTYATPTSAPGADIKAASGLNEVAKILLAPYVVVAL